MELSKEIEKSFPRLEKLFISENLTTFKYTPNGDLYIYHFGFGIWIRDHFLNETSTLYKLFINNGITDKDDMSVFIIELFYIHLTKNDI